MKIPELNKLLLCNDRAAGCLKLLCAVHYCWFCSSRRWLHRFLLPFPPISLLSVLVSALPFSPHLPVIRRHIPSYEYLEGRMKGA